MIIASRSGQLPGNDFERTGYIFAQLAQEIAADLLPLSLTSAA